MTKVEMAVKIINLRKALEVANRSLHEAGMLGVLAAEDEGPSFRDGRRFWAEVRRMTGGV